MKNKSPENAPRARKKTDSKADAAGAEDAPEAQDEVAAAPGEVRRGPLAALLGLLAVGLVVATYMAVAHLELFHGTGSFKSICNFGAHLSCDAVNTSDQSEIRGVGISIFALPVYAMLAFLVQRARVSTAKEARVALSLAHALAWPAVAYTAYLLFVMVFQLHTLCLFCLTLDTVNIAAVVLTAVAARARPQALLSEAWTSLDGPGKRPVLIAGGIGAVVLAVGLGGHAMLRASLEAEARAAVVSAPASSASGEPDEPMTIDDIIPRPGPRKLPTKRWQVPISDDDASVGPKDARVTVVQFADFQCSFCRKLEQALAPIRKTYATQARFVFKHYPMNPRCNPNVKNEKHSHACDAAAAGECARRQGKFWPMHDLLYDRQTHLDRPSLDADAAEVGLDAAAYAACMSDPTVAEAIARDANDGAAVKVTGTPRTYINGRLFSGVLSEDLLDFVIRIELGQVTGKEAEAYTPKGE
ncbi:MAG: thioredoxin domain-containing protein [Byssovorax sp.]